MPQSQAHVFSKGYLHDSSLSLSSVQHFLHHLRPSHAVTLLRHKGLADWIHTADQEVHVGASPATGAEERWSVTAKPGEMANRLESW